ncbi:MAG: hypothetical protein IKL02_07720 [Kiritimatiellae bacterium]|nr:hypothetical protein [Kiritimatiellia bacterium]
MWYDKKPLRGRDECQCRRDKTDFPRRSGFAKPFPRTWDASDGSLRNFTGKTQKKGNCPHNAVSPPSVYLSGLSQAPHPMHRRRFPFSVFSGVCQGASPRGTRPSRPVPQEW